MGDVVGEVGEVGEVGPTYIFMCNTTYYRGADT